MSVTLRFIFHFLYRFHFHHILLGFTHSFTRRSPSVSMFIRSPVRVHSILSFLLFHSWFLDSRAVLHNAIYCYITSSSFQLIFRVSFRLLSLVFTRLFVHFNPPHTPRPSLCFDSVSKHLIWAHFLGRFSWPHLHFRNSSIHTFSAGTLFFILVFICSSRITNTVRFSVSYFSW